MRNLLSTILCLPLLISNAFAEADGPDYWAVHGVKSNDVLNIRQHATWRADKIGEIPPTAQCVKNLNCVYKRNGKLIPRSKQWCFIEYQTITGWVAARYLRESTYPERCNDASL